MALFVFDRAFPPSRNRLIGKLTWAFDRLARSGRHTKQRIEAAFDAATAVLGFGAVFGLPMFSSVADEQWLGLLVPPSVTVASFALFGVYRWVVRSSNVELCRSIMLGASMATASILLLPVELVAPWPGLEPMPFVIFWLALSAGSVCPRLLWRRLVERPCTARGERIAIYGAGTVGRRLADALSCDEQLRAVVFIEDDASLIGTTVAGRAVLEGTSRTLLEQLGKLGVERVVLAIPPTGDIKNDARCSRLRHLGLRCDSESWRRAYGPDEGQVTAVSMDEILGRPEVLPDHALMDLRVAGRTVLVTGGGGSIGSELCCQIIRLRPRKLIVLDNGEANLYHVSEELERIRVADRVALARIRTVLGSVTDMAGVSALLREEGVDTIFHAAAYKHVPIVEAHPEQGVEVNIFGTRTVLDAALASGVSDFVLISTDKAVRPTNAMGASKRVAELLLQSRARERPRMRISMVRFGNVLGSSGSVVPKFIRQIEQGGPVTLTHPDITRYFMTIREAVQLVLQASAVARGGEVFVLDMGEPVRIEDLAINLVRLLGFGLRRETGSAADVDIHVSGLRPGEKMYEELFLGDVERDTVINKVFTARESSLSRSSLDSELVQIRAALDVRDNRRLRQRLLALAFSGINQQEPVEVDAGTRTGNASYSVAAVRVAAQRAVELPASLTTTLPAKAPFATCPLDGTNADAHN